MNIALSTFLIFIFLLPGIFFRRFYYSDQFSKEYIKQNVFGVFISTFPLSLIIHSIWFYLIQLFNYKVDFIIIGEYISGKDQSYIFENIQDNFLNIIYYNSTINIFSLLSGYLTKFYVRKSKLDRKYKIFRYRNNWHYILFGEFFDFPRAMYYLNNDTPEEIDYIFVDALVQIEEGTVIYEGMFVDYELSEEHGLDTITIKDVKRRFLKDDANTNLNHYSIPGNIIVLKYSEILNLNFSYYKLDFDTNNQIIPKLVS